MKKVVVLMVCCATVFACNSSGNKPADTTKKSADAAMSPETQRMLEMAATKLDCFTCHKINEAYTGPAYTAVAQKYEATDANIDMLANKIIKGGAGSWGQTPMLAHPALNIDTAKALVRAILSLRNQ